MTDRVERHQETDERPFPGFASRPPEPVSTNGSPSATTNEKGAGAAPAVKISGRRRTGRLRPETLAAIAAGGALGAPARYLIGKAVHVSSGSFPWGTFWINVTGSFVLGVLLTLIIERWPPTRFVRSFAGIGFLGAYTTISTVGVEADRLVSAGRTGVAAAYILASVVGGLGAVAVGISLARLWPGEARP